MNGGTWPGGVVASRGVGGAVGGGGGGGSTAAAVLQGVPRSVSPLVKAPHVGTPQNPEAGQADPCKQVR